MQSTLSSTTAHAFPDSISFNAANEPTNEASGSHIDSSQKHRTNSNADIAAIAIFAIVGLVAVLGIATVCIPNPEFLMRMVYSTTAAIGLIVLASLVALTERPLK